MKARLSFTILFLILSVTAFAGPYISATPQVLNSFSYTTGSGPSASKMVVLQSAIMALSSGTVTVTGATDYEVSLNNTAFSNTVTIPYSGDTLGATNLYVRLRSGLAVGNFMSETISVAATGVSQTITASGLVTSPCVITTGTITANNASFTWTATGAAGYECKIDQSSSAPATSGTPAATASYTQGSLSPGTAYYFHVRGVTSGNYTAWTTKAFSTIGTGISNTPGSSYSISLMPNPNPGVFTVWGTCNSKAGSRIAIVVMNAVGQVVYRTDALPAGGAFSKKVSLSAPAGIYTVRVGEGADCRTMRFSVAL